MKENTTIQKWDLHIKPNTKFLELNLKELLRYSDLITLFVKRDFISQYKQTILGPLWHMIQPLLTTLMFYILFGKIAKIGTGDIPSPLFYMTGLTLWNYFSTAFNANSNIFVSNAQIYGKVYFPRLAIPISISISNLIKLGIQFFILVVFILYYHISGIYQFRPSFSLILLPITVLITAFLSLSTGLFVSAFTTKYRDLGVLVTFGLQLLMYITPIAYPLSYVKNNSMTSFIIWNPLSPLIEGFRYSLYHTVGFNPYMLLYSLGFTIIMTIVGLGIFNKVEKTFMDTV